MSFNDYNGGSILAMVGKNCYAIASDKRLGSNQFHTVETNVEKVFPVTNKTMLAAVGLATDVQTIGNTIRFHKNMFHLREEREMKPNAVAHFVSNMLYKRRFSPWYLSTVVAGLDENDKPYVWDFDLVGGMEVKVCGYAAAGTAEDQILGMAGYLWREDLSAEELFEVCSQCLTGGLDRDCLSGWGAVIHVV